MTRPLILLTNDDGLGAAGLLALEAAAAKLGEVWVVAPLQEQSACSSSISLHDPLRIYARGERRFAIDGTPTDCVYIALQHILPARPALCLSGVNHGPNLGDDVLYSGTVAGALEATLSHIPSLATSLTAWGPGADHTVAAQVAVEIGATMLTHELPRDTLLNLNVPGNATLATPRRVTKLGRRNYERTVDERHDPRGKPYYWIGGEMLDHDDLPGSDCNTIEAGEISLTPIHVDLTHYRFLSELRTEWL